MTLIRTGVPRLPARVYVGMWIVDCGKCPQVYPAQPGSPIVECWRCGATTEIVWPSTEMVAGIERLLMMRGDPLNRHWLPGETLVDLMVENGKHGIFDDLDVTGTGPILTVEGERIRVDRLPVAAGAFAALGVR